MAGPVILPCALRGFTSTQDATQRGGTSRAQAGGRFVSWSLLAALALFAASTVSTHAQTRNWTGQFTSNWFLSGNWDSTFPRQTDDANINTVTPRSTVLSDPGAKARNLDVGVSGAGMLTIETGGTLADSSGAVGNLPGGLGTVTVTGAGSNWSNAGNVGSAARARALLQFKTAVR